MANEVFPVAKGRVNQLLRETANIGATDRFLVVLLKTAEADATLRGYSTLAALLAESGNEEADFTNYARKELGPSDVSLPTVDVANNRQDADLPDQTWTSAGGAVNNTTAKLLVCYTSDPANGDSQAIPLTHHDFVATTDGNDLVAEIDAAGFFRAA